MQPHAQRGAAAALYPNKMIRVGSKKDPGPLSANLPEETPEIPLRVEVIFKAVLSGETVPELTAEEAAALVAVGGTRAVHLASVLGLSGVHAIMLRFAENLAAPRIQPGETRSGVLLVEEPLGAGGAAL